MLIIIIIININININIIIIIIIINWHCHNLTPIRCKVVLTMVQTYITRLRSGVQPANHKSQWANAPIWLLIHSFIAMEFWRATGLIFCLILEVSYTFGTKWTIASGEEFKKIIDLFDFNFEILFSVHLRKLIVWIQAVYSNLQNALSLTNRR